MSFVRITGRASFVAACFAGLVGCGGSGPGDLSGQSQDPILTFANDKTAFDYFLGKGLANFQAAGIVGNLDQESGMDPTAIQSGGPGRGTAQWSVGGRWDTDTNDNAMWYANMQGKDVWSLPPQLDFIWYELTTFPSYGLSALQQSTNVTDATVAFQNDFEGCGTCDQSTRIAYAQAALAAYGNDQADAGPAPDAGGVSCFVPSLGESGVCILTTECAMLPGHVSTPGYCPGAADIQCCTGPAGSPDAGKPDAGGGSDSGLPGKPGAPDAASPPGSQPDGAAAPAEGDGGGAPNAAAPVGDSSGCSLVRGGTAGSGAGVWLGGLLGLALRRRRRSSGDALHR